jgi:hypothetical protein
MAWFRELVRCGSVGCWPHRHCCSAAQAVPCSRHLLLLQLQPSTCAAPMTFTGATSLSHTLVAGVEIEQITIQLAPPATLFLHERPDCPSASACSPVSLCTRLLAACLSPPCTGTSYDFIHPLDYGHAAIADMASWLLQQVVVDLGVSPWAEEDEAEVALPLMEPMYPGGGLWMRGGRRKRRAGLAGPA